MFKTLLKLFEMTFTVPVRFRFQETEKKTVPVRFRFGFRFHFFWNRRTLSSGPEIFEPEPLLSMTV
jgi:hypothetical protein